MDRVANSGRWSVKRNPSGNGQGVTNSLKFMEEDFMTVLAVYVECQTVDTVQRRVLERPRRLSGDGSGSSTSSRLFPLCLWLGWKREQIKKDHFHV